MLRLFGLVSISSRLFYIYSGRSLNRSAGDRDLIGKRNGRLNEFSVFCVHRFLKSVIFYELLAVRRSIQPNSNAAFA